MVVVVQQVVGVGVLRSLSFVLTLWRTPIASSYDERPKPPVFGDCEQEEDGPS